MNLLFLFFIPVLANVPFWSTIFNFFEPITDRTNWCHKNSVDSTAFDTPPIPVLIIEFIIFMFVLIFFIKDCKDNL